MRTAQDSEILAIFDGERRGLSVPGFRKEQTEKMSRSVSEGATLSWIDWSRHKEEEIDGAIDDEIAHFSALGRDFEWKVYDHDLPPDLRQRLAARGFSVGPAEAFLVLMLGHETLRDPAKSVEVRRMETLAQFEDYAQVERTMWPDVAGDFEESASRFTKRGGDEGYFVGYADGRPVSCGRVQFRADSRFAGLFGGATLEAFRGRGIYSALVAARLAEARRRGAEYAFSDALPTSRPILERFGFRQLSTTYPCVWRVARPALES